MSPDSDQLREKKGGGCRACQERRAALFLLPEAEQALIQSRDGEPEWPHSPILSGFTCKIIICACLLHRHCLNLWPLRLLALIQAFSSIPNSAEV